MEKDDSGRGGLTGKSYQGGAGRDRKCGAGHNTRGRKSKTIKLKLKPQHTLPKPPNCSDSKQTEEYFDQKALFDLFNTLFGGCGCVTYYLHFSRQ